MMARGLTALLLAGWITGLPVSLAQTATRPQPLKSGIEFSGAEVRALQSDEFANPGMLWVERGATLWEQPAGAENRACASCHGDAAAGMKGVATRYPQVDRSGDGLINLEGRIRQCREVRQHAAPLRYESEELLGLTAFIRMQSRGMSPAIAVNDGNRVYFERGRDFYYRRVGQMNLACVHCHQDNWGRKLGPETISQGHGNPYPAYRLEWQTMGSLHRRFRSCLSGVRAEMLPYGATAYIELELYLAWRSGELPIETPGVRR
jgi:sulfur-oxidizing protein SoxA